MTLPTDYTPEMCEKLLELFRQGISVPKATKALGICEKSVWRWCDLYPDFAERYAKAKEEGVAHLLDTSIDEIKRTQLTFDDGQGRQIGHTAAVTQAKLIAEQVRWLAEKVYPHKYGEKLRRVKIPGFAAAKDNPTRLEVLRTALEEGRISPTEYKTLADTCITSMQAEEYEKIKSLLEAKSK